MTEQISPYRRKSRFLVAAVCAAALTVSLPAHSFELFGFKFFGSKEENEEELTIGEPQKYNADFSVAGDVEGLEDKLKSASSLWEDREKPASGAAGLVAKARGDYSRLLAMLYSEGRYSGTISIRIDGQEAADLAPDAVFPETASVNLNVDPGPLFHFRQATIVNQAPPAQNRRDAVVAPQDEGYLSGEVAESGVILRAERLAVEAWRQQGHAKAKIEDRTVVAEHNGNVIDASINVQPGQKAYYGPVTVEGTEDIDPEWLAWMTGLEHGKEYDPDDFARASARIAKLDVFRAARFQEADMIGPDGLLPITYIVQERSPRRIGVGGSWSSVDGAGVEAFWMHRNLFGRAERLRFDAKVKGLGQTLKPDQLTYHIGASFIKPGVWTPDTDFTASAFGDREVLDAYTRTSVSGTAGLAHLFSKELSGQVFLKGGYAQFNDKEYGRRQFSTIGLSGKLTYDNRDSTVDATRGFLLEGTLEPFYEFQYSNIAVKATAEARAYHAFDDDKRFVLAGRAKIGMLAGPTADQLPPDMLFFAGGGGSVRGYAYKNIGVKKPSGNMIGGRSLAEASIETRVKITETIGVVGFADAGYVAEDTIPSFTEDLRLGVGAGLRYNTGLGPIRLDVAMPLNRRSGDPTVGFYVGLGQAF